MRSVDLKTKCLLISLYTLMAVSIIVGMSLLAWGAFGLLMMTGSLSMPHAVGLSLCFASGAGLSSIDIKTHQGIKQLLIVCLVSCASGMTGFTIASGLV